ncbi:hypothetical protein C7974DRAFT_469233 [Boeremia exigua]|uniref:uncharacterized protein n=1 Tax=Boeremia exigua TaxID=749465 RepID=UPI001E8D98F1|nr:uncharacterized protein C7974DRAFT_469233 [Boeremia exigua]KAH6643020.1 hypothetical protein C7974DRAFT_469233 [Boeremia exigua]
MSVVRSDTVPSLRPRSSTNTSRIVNICIVAFCYHQIHHAALFLKRLDNGVSHGLFSTSKAKMKSTYQKVTVKLRRTAGSLSAPGGVIEVVDSAPVLPPIIIGTSPDLDNSVGVMLNHLAEKDSTSVSAVRYTETASNNSGTSTPKSRSDDTSYETVHTSDTDLTPQLPQYTNVLPGCVTDLPVTAVSTVLADNTPPESTESQSAESEPIAGFWRWMVLQPRGASVVLLASCPRTVEMNDLRVSLRGWIDNFV